MRRDLERVPIPDADVSQERAWNVVRNAYVERTPPPRRSHWPRVAVVAVALGAVLAAALSPPGRAVIEEIRSVVGVEKAQPALFSLPAPGRLLVASDAGIWVVQQDGSKRLLGDYREASWSPFGRFVVAARENELVALEPDGDVRWTLARPGVRSPRWTGSESDTRIAYVDRTGLRVVAGDGTGDRLVAKGVRGPLAWRPGLERVLAHASAREVHVFDVDTGRRLWRVARSPVAPATQVEWSSDGRRLLVLSPRSLRIYDARGRIVDRNDPAEAWPNVHASLRPGSHEAAVTRVHGSQSTVFGLGAPRFRSFNGTGEFRSAVWSPDGRWYVVTWATADQWVFVRTAGTRRIRAVSNVSEQFRSRSFPRIEGWCCAPAPG